MPRNPSRPEKKRLLAVLLLIVLAFSLWMLLSPYGARRYYRLSHELRTMRSENDRLRQENRRLEEEIVRLKTDSAHLEELARKEMGFIRKNEILFDFSKKRPGAKK